MNQNHTNDIHIQLPIDQFILDQGYLPPSAEEMPAVKRILETFLYDTLTTQWEDVIEIIDGFKLVRLED